MTAVRRLASYSNPKIVLLQKMQELFFLQREEKIFMTIISFLLDSNFDNVMVP